MSDENKPEVKMPEGAKREVNMTCRRAADQNTPGTGCDSVRAWVMGEARQMHGITQYRCVKCNYTWSVSVGGFIDV
jgi:hypothetical protein